MANVVIYAESKGSELRFIENGGKNIIITPRSQDSARGFTFSPDDKIYFSRDYMTFSEFKRLCNVLLPCIRLDTSHAG